MACTCPLFFFIRGDFGSNVTPLDVDIYDRLKFS